MARQTALLLLLGAAGVAALKLGDSPSDTVHFSPKNDGACFQGGRKTMGDLLAGLKKSPDFQVYDGVELRTGTCSNGPKNTGDFDMVLGWSCQGLFYRQSFKNQARADFSGLQAESRAAWSAAHNNQTAAEMQKLVDDLCIGPSGSKSEWVNFSPKDNHQCYQGPRYAMTNLLKTLQDGWLEDIFLSSKINDGGCEDRKDAKYEKLPRPRGERHGTDHFTPMHWGCFGEYYVQKATKDYNPMAEQQAIETRAVKHWARRWNAAGFKQAMDCAKGQMASYQWDADFLEMVWDKYRDESNSKPVAVDAAGNSLLILANTQNDTLVHPNNCARPMFHHDEFINFQLKRLGEALDPSYHNQMRDNVKSMCIIAGSA